MRDNHAVIVDDGRIVAIEPISGTPDVPLLAAGFVDLQVNGHDDVDVATADATGWARLGRLLTDQGVTSWLPTLISAPSPILRDRLAAVTARLGRGSGPDAFGVHLEGPYLGEALGAHRDLRSEPIDQEWLNGLPDAVRLMTIGPERTGATSAITELVARGVVCSLGHTMATAEQAEAAVDAGATLFTHAFNASGVLHHRAPGALGVALSDDRLAVSLIADGIHVDPRVLRIAWRAKGPRGVVLVTDATAWRSGRLAEIDVALVDGAPRLPDGTLAGSALRMNDAVRYCVDVVGIDLVEALAAAAANPAGVLGLDDRGSITPGHRADLVGLRDDLQVEQTWVAGVAQPPTGSGV